MANAAHINRTSVTWNTDPWRVAIRDLSVHDSYPHFPRWPPPLLTLRDLFSPHWKIGTPICRRSCIIFAHVHPATWQFFSFEAKSTTQIKLYQLITTAENFERDSKPNSTYASSPACHAVVFLIPIFGDSTPRIVVGNVLLKVAISPEILTPKLLLEKEMLTVRSLLWTLQKPGVLLSGLLNQMKKDNKGDDKKIAVPHRLISVENGQDPSAFHAMSLRVNIAKFTWVLTFFVNSKFIPRCFRHEIFWPARALCISFLREPSLYHIIRIRWYHWIRMLPNFFSET